VPGFIRPPRSFRRARHALNLGFQQLSQPLGSSWWRRSADLAAVSAARTAARARARARGVMHSAHNPVRRNFQRRRSCSASTPMLNRPCPRLTAPLERMPMPVEPLTAREKRKLRREFRRKGYRAVYLEVSGYPQGKRACAHEWLRQKERASDRRKHWTLPFIVLGLTAAVVATYFAAIHLKWL
jgi:hypothetical protein